MVCGDDPILQENLIELLACPACKSTAELRFQSAPPRLVCPDCQQEYPIHDGVVELLTESNDPASKPDSPCRKKGNCHGAVRE